MRLIDADALIDAMEKTDWYHINEIGKLQHGANSELHTALYKAEDVYAVIENAPTIDAVPVVRCKDCKHLMFSDCYGECDRGHMGIVKPWDFCSYGKGEGNES